MKAIIYYFAQMILVSGILYGYYHFFLRNKRFHHYNRYYLLAIVVLGIVVPFLNIPVYFSQADTNSSAVLKTLTVISSGRLEEPTIVSATNDPVSHHSSMIPVYYLFYMLIAVVGIVRVLISLFKIRSIARNNPVTELDNIHFVNTSEPGTPFSFFRWLFWNRNIELKSSKGEHIFRHELFHIEQKHSRDIIFIEAVTIVAWLNPIFHLIKKELKAIHEFLADKFAATENSKWEYAELLLMQAFRTNQQLVNPFFHNQIKRRIAMITTSKKPGPQYFRKLMILPIAAILFALFAFSYRNKAKINAAPPFAKPITVVIDAGHGIGANGKYTGAGASNGTYEDDINLSIAKRIKEQNSNNQINILLTREDQNLVDLKKRVDFANEQHADLFISLHCNAAPQVLGQSNKSLRGMEVYFTKRNTTNYPENKILASILLNYFAQIYPYDTRIQQRDAGVYIIDALNCPSALVECGYLTDKQDLAFVSDPANQDKIAAAVLQSIETFASQKEGPDWEERKSAITDTLPKKDQPEKNIQDTSWNKNQKKAFIMEGGIAIKDKDGGTVYLSHARITVEGTDKNNKGKPLPDDLLFIIDGKERPDIKSIVGIEKLIDPSNVSSIDVLRGKASTAKYGEKGKNGVIIIKTKSKIVYDKEKGTLELIQPTDDNKIFDKVEIEPAFPGGDVKWRQYLERNVNPMQASKQAPSGTYTVVIQFIVNQEGKISDIKPLTNHGYGMEEEAMRVIKEGPDWIPALQNGHKVKAYKKQLITFMFSDDSGTFKEPNKNPNEKRDLNEVTVATLSPNAIGDENKIFEQTEVPASFPGGVTKWRQYLEQNCDGMVPVKNGAPNGNYTVMVQFIVDKEGNISEIKALTHNGYGMEEEAIRMISKGPRWKPAIQNGRDVKAYVKQPVTFVITAGN